MKFAIVLLMFIIYVQSSAAQDAIPDSIKMLGKYIAKFGGCFQQRFWRDVQPIRCKKNGNFIACVCDNQKQIAEILIRNIYDCIDPKMPFIDAIRKLSADIGDIGLSAVCGAYRGDIDDGNQLEGPE